VTESVAIGYPRRRVPADLPEQGELKVIYSRTDFINKDVPESGRPGAIITRYSLPDPQL